MVDLDGFEPSTSSMPWKRAPNCATGPLTRQFNTEAQHYRISMPDIRNIQTTSHSAITATTM
jgi:hypothetical protein